MNVKLYCIVLLLYSKTLHFYYEQVWARECQIKHTLLSQQQGQMIVITKRGVVIRKSKVFR